MCRLINAAYSEMGRVGKKILERLAQPMEKHTASVIDWFENIKNKENSISVIFDVDIFYLSISENLLKLSLNHVKQFANIAE